MNDCPHFKQATTWGYCIPCAGKLVKDTREAAFDELADWFSKPERVSAMFRGHLVSEFILDLKA